MDGYGIQVYTLELMIYIFEITCTRVSVSSLLTLLCGGLQYNDLLIAYMHILFILSMHIVSLTLFAALFYVIIKFCTFYSEVASGLIHSLLQHFITQPPVPHQDGRPQSTGILSSFTC